MMIHVKPMTFQNSIFLYIHMSIQEKNQLTCKPLQSPQIRPFVPQRPPAPPTPLITSTATYRSRGERRPPSPVRKHGVAFHFSVIFIPHRVERSNSRPKNKTPNRRQ